MQVAVTGATGFIGRYIVKELLASGHSCRCWYRQESKHKRFDAASIAVDATDVQLTWIPGSLDDESATHELLDGCQAVVHAALDRPGAGFRGSEGDIVDFAQRNIIGSLRLMDYAQRQNMNRFVFVSTCAVHEKILDDRPLDEKHPLWPMTHYGAHKAALEKFVHSYGLGMDFPICAVRPTGVYGVANPVEQSKWYDLVGSVVRGETVHATGGGKEVHAGDVAKAINMLLTADEVAGEAFSCYDRYVAKYEVAQIARELSGSSAEIKGEMKTPKHQIETGKLRDLGMQFGGDELLRETIGQLVDALH